eukprot:507270-Rhodomonas_salina.1
MRVEGGACSPKERSHCTAFSSALACRNPRQRKRVDVGGVPIARHAAGRREASRDGRASRIASA